MNIFILDLDIQKNVEYHCDKHIVKQVLEYSQLLSTACHVHKETVPEIDITGMYRCTHKNHPNAKWVRESRDNFIFLLNTLKALLQEYTHRYGREHATTRLIPLFEAVIPFIPQGEGVLTPFAIVVKDDCIVDGDVVSSYHNYYMKYKRELCVWKNRDVPEWYV